MDILEYAQLVSAMSHTMKNSDPFSTDSILINARILSELNDSISKLIKIYSETNDDYFTNDTNHSIIQDILGNLFFYSCSFCSINHIALEKFNEKGQFYDSEEYSNSNILLYLNSNVMCLLTMYKNTILQKTINHKDKSKYIFNIISALLYFCKYNKYNITLIIDGSINKLKTNPKYTWFWKNIELVQ